MFLFFSFVNTFLLLQSQKRRFEIQNVVKELKSIINNECNWGPEQFGTTCRVTFFSFVQKSLHPTVYIASSSSCFAIPNHYLSSFYKKYFSFFTQLIKTSKITVFPGIKQELPNRFYFVGIFVYCFDQKVFCQHSKHVFEKRYRLAFFYNFCIKFYTF